MSSKKSENISYKITSQSDESVEVEPPEGGWGYMVCLSYAFMILITTGPMSSFGLIYNDFFKKIGLGTSGVTFISGVFNVAVSLTGFFTANALKYFTLRQVGMLGAVLFILGSIGAIFVSTVGELIFCISVLQGMGFGILLPVCLTSFNTYFREKRAALMSASSVVAGLGAMFYPMTIKWLMEVYGFRGTLIIIAAINVHLIPIITIFRPVEWSYIPKKTKKYSVSNMLNFNDVKVANDKLSDFSDNNEKSTTQPLILRSDRLKNLSSSFSTLPDFKDSSLRRKLTQGYIGVEDFNSLSKTSSMASIGNWTSNVIANDVLPPENGKWHVFRDFFDISLLKDLIYVNMCMGTALSTFADLTFFNLEPILLYEYGFDNNEVAICITVTCVTDLLARAIFAVLSFAVKIKSRYIFFAGITCTFILQLVFMEYIDFKSVVILTGCLGFFRSWIHVFLPLVYAEYCSQEKFSAAYGLSMIVTGIISVTLGSFIGLVRDYTNSYYVAIHCISGCIFITVICWSVEIIYQKYKHHKNNESVNNASVL